VNYLSDCVFISRFPTKTFSSRYFTLTFTPPFFVLFWFCMKNIIIKHFADRPLCGGVDTKKLYMFLLDCVCATQPSWLSSVERVECYFYKERQNIFVPKFHCVFVLHVFTVVNCCRCKFGVVGLAPKSRTKQFAAINCMLRLVATHMYSFWL
jgi:hypothetical protein